MKLLGPIGRLRQRPQASDTAIRQMPSIRTIWYQPFSAGTLRRAPRNCRELRSRWRALKVAALGELVTDARMRFRLFFTDKLTRRIISLIELEAADAVKAVALAEERRTQSGMELWAKGGLIKRWRKCDLCRRCHRASKGKAQTGTTASRVQRSFFECFQRSAKALGSSRGNSRG